MLTNEMLTLMPIDIEMIDALLVSNDFFKEKYHLANDAGEFLIPDDKYLFKIKNRMISHPKEYPLAVDHLIILSETKTVIGSIYFKRLPIQGISEIGYGMNPRYEGHGYMTLAVKMMLEYGKDNGINTVLADTTEDNIKSQNVLLRNGFIEDSRENNKIFYIKDNR